MFGTPEQLTLPFPGGLPSVDHGQLLNAFSERMELRKAAHEIVDRMNNDDLSAFISKRAN